MERQMRVSVVLQQKINGQIKGEFKGSHLSIDLSVQH